MKSSVLGVSGALFSCFSDFFFSKTTRVGKAVALRRRRRDACDQLIVIVRRNRGENVNEPAPPFYLRETLSIFYFVLHLQSNSYCLSIKW